MPNMELLGALEVEKLTKQKWEQYCGTPCNTWHLTIRLKMKKIQSDYNSNVLVKALRSKLIGGFRLKVKNIQNEFLIRKGFKKKMDFSIFPLALTFSVVATMYRRSWQIGLKGQFLSWTKVKIKRSFKKSLKLIILSNSSIFGVRT